MENRIINTVEYSIIIPAYNEEDNIRPLVDRIKNTMVHVNGSYEIVIVDNGSYDSSPMILENLLRQEKSIVVVTLSRNFGYDGAITTGLKYASGNWVIIMDGDQQDPPESIPEFIHKAKEGFSIVYGIRSKRTEGILIGWQIKIFYKLWKIIANIDTPRDAGNFGIMSQEVVKIINRMPERNKFLRGLRAWTGYPSIGIKYQRDDRKSGETKFSYLKYTNYALNGITSFSTIPLRILTYVGSLGLIICTFFSIFLIFSKIVEILGYLPYKIASGTTTLALLMIIAISVNILSMGILGEYISRIMEEVKNRPSALVTKVNYSNNIQK